MLSMVSSGLSAKLPRYRLTMDLEAVNFDHFLSSEQNKEAVAAKSARLCVTPKEGPVKYRFNALASFRMTNASATFQI